MTRLFDVPYGQLQEFLKRLAQAGLTGEMLTALTQDQDRMRQWVGTLTPPPTPPSDPTETRISVLFADKAYARMRRTFEAVGIERLEDLTDWAVWEISNLPEVGGKSVKELIKTLESYGLKFATYPSGDPARIYGNFHARPDLEWGTCYHWFRRDALDDVLFVWFADDYSLRVLNDDDDYIPIEKSDPVCSLTISQIKAMSDAKLAEYAKPVQIRRIRSWVAENVR